MGNCSGCDSVQANSPADPPRLRRAGSVAAPSDASWASRLSDALVDVGEICGDTDRGADRPTGDAAATSDRSSSKASGLRFSRSSRAKTAGVTPPTTTATHVDTLAGVVDASSGVEASRL